MSASFGINNAAISSIGSLATIPTGGNQQWPIKYTVQFKFTGTRLAFRRQSFDTDTYKLSVDGAAAFTVDMVESGDRATVVEYDLINSLTEGDHTVIMTRVTGGVGFFDTDNTFVVYGAAPAIAAWGYQKFNLYSPPNYIRVDGAWGPAAPAGNWCVSDGYGGEIKFRAKIAAIRVFSNFGDLGEVNVWQDDTRIVYRSGGESTDALNVVTIISGLDDTTYHDYRVVCRITAIYLSFLLLADTDVMNTTAIPARKQIVFGGDSTTTGNGVSGDTFDNNFPYKIALQQDWGLRILASSGSVTPAAFSSFPLRTWDYIFDLWGINDANGQFTNIDTFQTQTETLIANTLSWLKVDGKLLIEQIFPTDGTSLTNTNRTNYNARKQLAAEGAGDARVFWTTGSDNLSPSNVPGLHPNNAGADELVVGLLASIASVEVPPTPDTPANLAVSAGVTGITITFDRSANHADFDDLSYFIERSTDNSNWSALTNFADGASPSFLDVNVALRTYYYRIFASSLEFGESSISSEQHTTATGPVATFKVGKFLSLIG